MAMVPSLEERAVQASSSMNGEGGNMQSLKPPVNNGDAKYDSPIISKRGFLSSRGDVASSLEISDLSRTPQTDPEDDNQSLLSFWQDKEAKIIQQLQNSPTNGTAAAASASGKSSNPHDSSPLRSPHTKARSMAAKFDRQTHELNASVHTVASLDITQAVGSSTAGGRNSNREQNHPYQESFTSTMAVSASPSSVVRGSRIFKIDGPSLGPSSLLNNFLPPITSSSEENDRSWMMKSNNKSRPVKNNRTRVKSNSTGSAREGRTRTIGGSQHRRSLSPIPPATIEEEIIDAFSGDVHHEDSQDVKEGGEGSNRDRHTTKISACETSVISSDYEGTRISACETSVDDVSIPTFADTTVEQSGHTRSSHSGERIRNFQTSLTPIKDTKIKDDSKGEITSIDISGDPGDAEIMLPVNFGDGEEDDNDDNKSALDVEDEEDHEEALRDGGVREFVVDRVPSKKKRWTSKNIHNCPVWPPIIKVMNYEAKQMSGVSVGSGFSDDDLTDDFVSSVEGDEFSFEDDFEEHYRRPLERRTSYRIRYDGPSTLNTSRFGLPPVPRIDDRFETNVGHTTDGNPGVPGRTADAAPSAPMRRRNSREGIDMSNIQRDDGSIDGSIDLLLVESEEKRPDVWITPMSGTTAVDAMWKVKRVWAIESEDEKEHEHSVHNRELFTKIKSLVGAPDSPPGFPKDSQSESLPAASRDGTPRMPTRSWHVQTVLERKGRVENMDAEKQLCETEFEKDIEVMAVEAVKEIELNKTAEEAARKVREQKKVEKQSAEEKTENWENLDEKLEKCPEQPDRARQTLNSGLHGSTVEQIGDASKETIDRTSYHSLTHGPAIQAEEVIDRTSSHSPHQKQRPAMQRSPNQRSPKPIEKRRSLTDDEAPVPVLTPDQSVRKSVSGPPLSSPISSPTKPDTVENCRLPPSAHAEPSKKGKKDLLKSPRREKSASKDKTSSKSKRRSSTRSSSLDSHSRSASPKSPKRNSSSSRLPRRSKKSDLLKAADEILTIESPHSSSKKSPRKEEKLEQANDYLNNSTHSKISKSKSPKKSKKLKKEKKKRKSKSKQIKKSENDSEEEMSDGSDRVKNDRGSKSNSPKHAKSTHSPPLTPRRVLQMSAMVHDSDSDSSSSSDDSSDDEGNISTSTRRFGKGTADVSSPAAEKWWQKGQTNSPKPQLKTPTGGRSKLSSGRRAPDVRAPPLSTKKREGAKNRLGRKLG